jgi:hypothetical protein
MKARIETGADGRRRAYSRFPDEVRAALESAGAVLTKGWQLADGLPVAIFFDAETRLYHADLGSGA